MCSGCVPSREKETDISPYWTGCSSWKMNAICSKLGRQQKRLLGPEIDSPTEKQHFPAIACLPNYETAYIESVCFPQQAPDQRLNGKLDAHIQKESKYLRSIFAGNPFGRNKFARPSVERHWLIPRVHRLFSSQVAARKSRHRRKRPRCEFIKTNTERKKKHPASIIISAHNMCCWRELLGSGFVPAPAPAQQHAIRSPASVYICILITAGHDKRERENGRMGRRTHSQVHINPIAQFCVHGLARLVQMKTHGQTEEALVCCFCGRSLVCVFCTKGGVGCKHTEVKIKARFGDLMIVHYETTAVVSFHL